MEVTIINQDKIILLILKIFRKKNSYINRDNYKKKLQRINNDVIEL